MILDDALLKSAAGLADPGNRLEESFRLARAIGAEELVVFTYDPEAKAHLPALGFRQTFPDGRNLKLFLSACIENGTHSGTLCFRTGESEVVSAIGRLMRDRSILLLLGGSPSAEGVDRTAAVLSLVAPVFAVERKLLSVVAYNKVLTSAEVDSTAYSKTLERTRKQLEKTVLELKESEAKVRTMAEAAGSDLATLQSERDLRERFVATLTHDLRSPMTAARMSAQLIMRKIDVENPAHRQAAKVVANIDRADHMIQNLLDANLIRAGERIPLKRERCDLNRLVQDTVDDMITVHGDRFSVSSGPPIVGYWSISALRRVLENLIGNAIKYGAPYRPVTIALEEGPNQIRFSVQNEGNPLSVEEQASIFDQYRRTASARAGQQAGWGLGLTLVRGIAEAHGGKVSVESSPEKGTLFSVTLPTGSAEAGPTS